MSRLRELTERAIGCLGTETLNLLSFHLAVYLDHETDQPLNETERMRRELDGEQRAARKTWKKMERQIDPDDGRTP